MWGLIGITMFVFGPVLSNRTAAKQAAMQSLRKMLFINLRPKKSACFGHSLIVLLSQHCGKNSTENKMFSFTTLSKSH